MLHKTFLLLGSNLGDRLTVLAKAQQKINAIIGTINNQSSVFETLAWGVEDQPAFLNQVLLVDTPLTPQNLLKEINQIENDLGRVRYKKWGERLIDIDILYFNDEIVDDDNLIIPHPEIANRRFTLVPLVEIAANYEHPILGKTQKELLLVCNDELEVNKYQ